MAKLIFKFIGLVVGFFLVWGIASQVDWVNRLKVKQTQDTLEEKIGDLYQEMIEGLGDEITEDSLTAPFQSMIDTIIESNNLSADVKLHLIRSEEINAFAMPDDHIVLFTGLIDDADKAEEVAGVLGHEIAHLEERHVMKKLVKEVGLGVLISMTSGGGGQAVREAVKALTSSAYDRSLESEADEKALQYLKEANIDYRPFADFLYKMALKQENVPSQMYWISTHPESEKRAEAILKGAEMDEKVYAPIMEGSEWLDLKNSLLVDTF